MTATLDFRTARAANGRLLYAWLEQRVGLDELRGDHADRDDRARWAMLRAWRDGRRAQARFSNVDAVLAAFGLELSQVPDDVWEPPLWGRAARRRRGSARR